MKAKLHLNTILFQFAISIIYFSSTISVLHAQNKTSVNSKTNYDIQWLTYFNSKGIKIEYSYQENNPNSGFKAEYIVFKIINNTKNKCFVSWDFSSIDQDGICLNCNSKNKELHYEATIPSKSYYKGNLSLNNKGGLVIFNRFTDKNYIGKSRVGWKSFDLKNLSIK